MLFRSALHQAGFETRILRGLDELGWDAAGQLIDGDGRRSSLKVSSPKESLSFSSDVTLIASACCANALTLMLDRAHTAKNMDTNFFIFELPPENFNFYVCLFVRSRGYYSGRQALFQADVSSSFPLNFIYFDYTLSYY